MTPGRFWLRLLPFAVSILASAYATYLQLAPRSDAATLDRRLIIAVAACAALGPIFGTTFESVNRADYKFGLKISTEVIALHEALCDLHAFSNLNIGYTVFRVRRSPRPPFWRIQARIYRLRLTANPKPSTVRWVKRKGLLGECWRRQEKVYLDHQKHFSGVRADRWWNWWFRVPASTRQWLSFSDYKSIKKYHHVIAYPLEDPHSGEYCGCLVIQVPNRSLRDRLDKPDATRVLERVTAAIASHLS